MSKTKRFYTNDKVKEILEKRGQKLLSENYVNCWSEIRYICNCGLEETRKFCEYSKKGHCKSPIHHRLVEDKIFLDKGLPLRPRKSGDKWIYRDLIFESERIFGKDVLSFENVTKDMYLTNTTRIKPKCNLCQFVWITDIERLFRLEKGCPWCENECVHSINLYTIEIIEFISNKIHKNLYTYQNNDREKIMSSTDKIFVNCIHEEHGVFTEPISKHLSRAKGNYRKTQGCEECKKLEGEKKMVRNHHRIWKGKLDMAIEESVKIHGNIYDFSLNQADKIENHKSILKIICKKCCDPFDITIDYHINEKMGCKACKNLTISLSNFKPRAYEKYGDKFNFEDNQEEDVTNSESSIKAKCNVCNCVIFRSVNTLINRRVLQKCPECENREKWDKTKAMKYCGEKKKEGLYSYEDVNFEQIVNKNTKILITCIKCSEEKGKKYQFEQSLGGHFIAQNGCKRCSKRIPWNYELFLEKLTPLMKKCYDYSEVKPEMINSAKSIISFKCNVCKKTSYKQLRAHVNNGVGCSYCNKSILEKLAYDCLNFLEIKFQDEVELRIEFGNSLFYDYVFSYNNKVFVLEVDGGQHFEYKEFLHRKIEEYQSARERDIQKQKIALQEGRKMIRICDVKTHDEMMKHIKKAIELAEDTYYSHPEKYDWLS